MSVKPKGYGEKKAPPFKKKGKKHKALADEARERSRKGKKKGKKLPPWLNKEK